MQHTPSHPTTREVANYLAEASGITQGKVALVPYSVTNGDNFLALAVASYGGIPWTLEPDTTKYWKLQSLSYVTTIWPQSFADWAQDMQLTHRSPDPSKQVKVPVIILDINATARDYTLAWQFLRNEGTLVGIVHPSVSKRLGPWITAKEAELEPFPHELNVQYPYWFLRATKYL